MCSWISGRDVKLQYGWAMQKAEICSSKNTGPDQGLQINACCFLYHVLWATSVVCTQQLHLAVWTCACGTSIWILCVACLSPGLWWCSVDLDTVSLKSSSCFCGTLRAGSWWRYVLYMCALTPSVWNTHRGVTHRRYPEIKHFKGALDLPSRLTFYLHCRPLPWLEKKVVI